MEFLNVPTSNQIRAARQLLDLTQMQFASEANVSVSSLKKYENAELDIQILSILSYSIVSKILSYCAKKNIKFIFDECEFGVLIQNR